MSDQISQDIYLSRDSIRKQISDLTKQYLDLQNVDLTQSSFLSYIIDVLSTLTSNLLFYQTNVYKEFFLTTAQLPESIYNLSSFIGYKPKEATYSSVNLLLTFPLQFTQDVSFQIPEFFNFQTSDGIPFQTFYTTYITITNNSIVTAKVLFDDGRTTFIPVSVDSVNQQFFITLPVKQYIENTQEFQIDTDLQIFQFPTVLVPLKGEISSIQVYVRDPTADINSSGVLYSEFSSLYLMSSTDTGYVVRKNQTGRTLYFGNGIIGIQPKPGSTIIVKIMETMGSLGNVIAGTIKSGDRIYTTQNNITVLVNYTIQNTSPSFGGTDEESVQDVRSNSIANLTTSNRLVTYNDYIDAPAVIKGTPFGPNSIPVLKRSDLKVNEICLFNSLLYQNNFLPIRNTTYIGLTINMSSISRGTVININGVDYVTLFDITTDPNNNVAYYRSVITQTKESPVLSQSYSNPQQNTYNIILSNVTFVRTGNSIVATVYYVSNELDFSNVVCNMMILGDPNSYIMTNIPSINGGTFVYTFTNYLTNFSDGELSLTFKLSNSNLPYQKLISDYTCNVIIHQSLDLYMMSTTLSDGLGNSTIYDVPVLQLAFYNLIVDKEGFETDVLQNMINALSLSNYKMLTDFINVKFYNTTGTMTNMLLNNTTVSDVLDIGIDTLPITGNVGDRYIISGSPTLALVGKEHNIAVLKDLPTNYWIFLKPMTNDIVYVTSKGTKYVYSSAGWMIPVYDIPLQISMEVFKDKSVSISDVALIENIKNAIYNFYQPNFGANLNIYRSEITDIVQSVVGVSNCRVIEPRTNIFFNYDISTFTQPQLLTYTPELVYFTLDDIEVIILTSF